MKNLILKLFNSKPFLVALFTVIGYAGGVTLPPPVTDAATDLIIEVTPDPEPEAPATPAPVEYSVPDLP